MAYAQPQAWYIHQGDGSSTGYFAVPVYSNKAWTAGQLTRPLTGTGLNIGNERVYVCTTAGTSTVEPTWTFTKGSAQNATGATFTECTGEPGLNGDISSNCPIWNASSNPPLGRVIYVSSNNSLQICTVSSGNSLATIPAFSATAGVVTNDNANRWTCLGLASSFGTWAAPHCRAANAFLATWGANGNDFYIADNSTDLSNASVTLTIGLTTALSRIFSIDHTAALPPNAAALKPGATIASSNAANGALSIASGNSAGSYWYGIIFVSTASFSGQTINVVPGSLSNVRFEACSFRLAGTNAAQIMTFGTNCTTIELINCTMAFAATTQLAQFAGGIFTWRNTADPCFPSGLVGGFTYVVPSPILRGYTAGGINLLIEGVDLNSVGSNTLVANNTGGGLITIKNCKLSSTGLVTGGANSGGAAFICDVIDSDSGTQTYRNERYGYYGALTTSTTVVRTGGATDGVTPISHSIVASANAKPFKPFNSFPLVIWNTLTGSARTLTLYGTLPGASQPLPFNDQFWFDVEYMGSAATPLALLASNGLATQLTPHAVNAVADGSSWSGGANTPFSLAVTFTAQQVGYVTVYPRAANLTFYLDPKPVLS
jgi:hypothetical protein